MLTKSHDEEQIIASFDCGARRGRVYGGVEGLPSGLTVLVVKRGPNAGSRFLLDQPVTSASRHPNSDIFLDDVTVSRRHAEFRRGKRRIPDR